MSAADIFDFDEMVGEAPEEATELQGARYPNANWTFGDPKMARVGGAEYHGGFFVGAETLKDFAIDPADMEAAGFVKDIITTKKGDVDGYSTTLLNIFPVRIRRRWLKNSGEALTWSAGFDFKANGGSARAHMQMVALIKGLEQYGLWTLTFKGTSQSKWYGVKPLFDGEGLLDEIDATLVKSAGQFISQRGKKAALFTFALPVGVKFVTKGKGKTAEEAPNFIEVGYDDKTQIVVVPELLWPEEVEISDEMSREDLAKFMDRDAYRQAVEAYKENEEWQHEWDDEETVSADATAFEEEAEEDGGMDDEVEEVEIDGVEV